MQNDFEQRTWTLNATRILLALSLVVGSLIAFLAPIQALAQKGDPIGFELIEESQDIALKSYTVTVEGWSNENALSFAINPRTEGEGLEIITKEREWKGPIKANKRYRQAITVRNGTKETRILLLDLKRKTKTGTDTKTVSVMVAPQ